MIVLDEQIMRQRIATEIDRWYRGRVTNILALRPETVIKDDAIPALLLHVQQPTFVTINTKDFWLKIPAHRRYCVIAFDLPQTDVFGLPSMLHSLLRREQFATKANRMGKVIRVKGERIRYYSLDYRIVSI